MLHVFQSLKDFKCVFLQSFPHWRALQSNLRLNAKYVWVREPYLLNRTLCTPASAAPSPASQISPFWSVALGNLGKRRSLWKETWKHNWDVAGEMIWTYLFSSFHVFIENKPTSVNTVIGAIRGGCRLYGSADTGKSLYVLVIITEFLKIIFNINIDESSSFQDV